MNECQTFSPRWQWPSAQKSKRMDVSFIAMFTEYSSHIRMHRNVLFSMFSSSLQSQHPVLLAHHVITCKHLPSCYLLLTFPAGAACGLRKWWARKSDRWLSHLPLPESHLRRWLLMAFLGATGFHCSTSCLVSFHGSAVSGKVDVLVNLTQLESPAKRNFSVEDFPPTD